MLITIFLYAIAFAVIYFITYVVSLYSVAAYIDPEELSELSGKTTRRREQFLRTMAGDPRAFVQIAVVYKSCSLIVTTVITYYVAQSLAGFLVTNMILLLGVLLLVQWVMYLYTIEYLPRRQSRRALNEKLVTRLWFMVPLWYAALPVIQIYRKLLGQRKIGEPVTEEEKDDLIERAIETLADQAGIAERIVEEDEKKMIGQIFRLDHTIVREIMVPRIDMVGIDRTMSFSDIRSLVLADGHSRYPVFNGTIDQIVGMLYVKDLFGRLPEPGEKFVIAKYLRKPYFVPETKIIGTLLREFKARRLHIAIVVDEFGGVAGLVTLEDIIEEIFGEIQDEHDWEEDPFQKLEDGRLKVDAGLLLEDLQDYLDTDYDQGDYDTVGGLIYDLFGSVPREGQKIRWNDIEFEINRIEGQRIRSVLIRYPELTQ
jgi:CBS domain containing-hemolysin-like protein